MKNFLAFLFPYRSHLEAEILIQRADFLDRLRDKDARVAQLETELGQVRGECERMRLVLMPLSTAAGAAYVRTGQAPSAPPKPLDPIITGWQHELKSFMEAEEKREKADGVQIQER